MTFQKNMYTFTSNDKHSFRCLFVLAVVLMLMIPSGAFAQKYVTTEKAKEKAAKLAADKANRPAKLVYAVEKKNMVQKFLEDSTAVINGFQVNVDLVGPIQSMLSDKKYYEVGARLSIKDIVYPAVELGYGNTDYVDVESGTFYNCGGLYGRLGFDFNMMKDKHDDYKLFLGARLGYSNFKFDVSVPDAQDPVWGGNAEYKVKDASCNYLWLEFLAGVDARIAGPVHLGWTMRYKRKMNGSYSGIDKAWYVPGYGNDDTSGFGATFTVGVEIYDFLKKKKVSKVEAILNELDNMNAADSTEAVKPADSSDPSVSADKKADEKETSADKTVIEEAK